MSRLLFIPTLIVVLTSSLEAQTTPIRSGDHVRVRSTVVSGDFVVAAVAGDTIVLRDGVRVPQSSMTALHVKRQQPPARTAAVGAGAGALAGVAGALALGVIVGEEDGFFGSTGEIVAGLIVPFSLGGAAVGALGALIFPGERWSRVPLSGQPQIGRRPDGRVQIGYAMPVPR